MSDILSFSPISDSNSKVLILGSMPGRPSIEYREYYRHPRNCFWEFMTRITGALVGESYDSKIRILLDHRIAIWDVLRYCERKTSLDKDIKNERANNFTSFYADHLKIQIIFFNGIKARNSY